MCSYAFLLPTRKILTSSTVVRTLSSPAAIPSRPLLRRRRRRRCRSPNRSPDTQGGSVAVGFPECGVRRVVGRVEELDCQLVQGDVLGGGELGQGDEMRLADAVDVELPGHE